jgi:hypothetical protein
VIDGESGGIHSGREAIDDLGQVVIEWFLIIDSFGPVIDDEI